MAPNQLCNAGKSFSLCEVCLICKGWQLNVGSLRSLSDTAVCGNVACVSEAVAVCFAGLLTAGSVSPVTPKSHQEVPHKYTFCQFPQVRWHSFLFWTCPLFALSSAIASVVPWVAASVGCKVYCPSPPSQPWGINVLVMPSSFRICTLLCWDLKQDCQTPPLTSEPWEHLLRGTVKSLWKLWRHHSNSGQRVRLYFHKEYHELVEHPRPTKYRTDLIRPWKPLRQTHYLRSHDKLYLEAQWVTAHGS